jgi:hypothetical protein
MKSIALQMARANKNYMGARATLGVFFPVALSSQASFIRIFRNLEIDRSGDV